MNQVLLSIIILASNSSNNINEFCLTIELLFLLCYKSSVPLSLTAFTPALKA